MVRILALGDFHGSFPDFISKIIKKEKIDLIVSNGDYLPFLYRELWFKHCYRKDNSLWDIIGKKKYKELVKRDLKFGENVLKKMQKLPVKVLTTLGNVDYPIPDDVSDIRKPTGKKFWKWDFDSHNHFAEIISKYSNIVRIDYKAFVFEDLVFIGARGHTFPGRVKSKAYKKHKKLIEKLFAKFSKENKSGRVIFLSHNVPYDTNLDKIDMKAHPAVRGKHYGSKLIRRVIDKYQPSVHIGGHIHEGRGKQFLGKTLCVNPGSIHEGKAAIIDLSVRSNKNIKVRFIN